MLRRAVNFVVPVAIAASTLLAGAVPAAAASAASAQSPALTRSTPVTRGSEYLALGDSVTFGYQEPQVVPAPDYVKPSSFPGYPEQIGAQLHLKVTNLACPGETSASLVNASAPSNGCENAKAGYRALFPLHVRYRGAQLAYAVSFLRKHSGVRLVSLMIGANDLFLCQRLAVDHCQSPSELSAALAKISANVRRILSAIRSRAHYGGQLAIVQYYSLDYASALVNSESQALNQAMDKAAKPFHVVFANGYGTLRKSSAKFGDNPCLAGLLTQLGAYGSCGVHPSYAGQALLAQALIRAIRL